MIKVLIVDDSPVAREFLAHILAEAGMQVVGAASDGAEAVESARRTRPDVVTMDIHMPRMNGIDATRRIMETCPAPIVVVSANWDPGEVEMTFRAMEAGALAIVRRPPGIGHPEHQPAVAELIQKVRTMSEVKVVRRWPPKKSKPAAFRTKPRPAAVPDGRWGRICLVAIGASTGGPPVLQTILNGIPREFPAPILIVQHIAPGFLPGMLSWLGTTCALDLHLASDGVKALPGHVYFAPDGAHLGITNSGALSLSNDQVEHGARPSVSYLFRSVAQAYGGNAAAILLTGMGADGARELKLLREKGAVTMAQNKESSVVYGMPAAAVELDAAEYVVSPDQIPPMLVGIAAKSNAGGTLNA